MFSPNRFLIGGALLLGLAFATQGCSNSAATGSGRMQILITDAPSDYLASAEIWVSHVYLQGGGEDNDPRTDLYNDPANPKHFDLLDLQNGITAELTAELEVPAGNYSQLRVVIDSARVTLIAGLTFTGGGNTRRLTVPSGSQSGIKIQLDESLELDEGEVMIVLVDVDVDQNFVIQGNPPAGINGIIFTPSIHEMSRVESGG